MGTAADKLHSLVQELEWEQRYWSQLHKKGVKNPYSRDGNWINLCRDRIITARNKIQDLCEKEGEPLPMAYYTPVPPKAPDGYVGPGSTGQDSKATIGEVVEFWEPKVTDKKKKPLPIMDQGSLF